MKSPLELLQEVNKNNIGRRSDSKVTIVGKGSELPPTKVFQLDDNLPSNDILIDDDMRTGHVGCFGTTRVGKTKLIENLISQDIAKGYNVVVIDPKGDTELCCRIVQTCMEYGRLDDLMMLTPIFPDCSMRLNPLSHWYMQDELVDHVVSGIKSKEDYYIAIATSVTQAIVQGLILQSDRFQKRPQINFNEIRRRADFVSLKDFRDQFVAYNKAKDLTEELNQILAAPLDFFAKVSSSLLTTLRALTTGNVGEIIGKAFENEFLSRIERKQGVVLFCNTGSLLARRTAHIVGKVIVSSIQSLIGRWLSSGKKLNPPLCLHIDEAHNVMYRGIQELFNKCGGGNVWVHIYTQSIAQIVDEIGEESAISILDNINTWIYMLVNHPETARYIEEATPEARQFEPTFRFDAGLMMRSDAVPMITSQQLLSLQRRQFFMRHYGRFFYGRTADVKPLLVNVTYPEINRQYVEYLPEMVDDSGREADIENRLFEASEPESRIQE
ncbi:MAG: type IV secretory system conjugative DNA transfer family protein [Syntrophales bacterium]|jgi:conjugal transfer pilus assembly protein TraD